MRSLIAFCLSAAAVGAAIVAAVLLDVADELEEGGRQ